MTSLLMSQTGVVIQVSLMDGCLAMASRRKCCACCQESRSARALAAGSPPPVLTRPETGWAQVVCVVGTNGNRMEWPALAQLRHTTGQGCATSASLSRTMAQYRLEGQEPSSVADSSNTGAAIRSTGMRARATASASCRAVSMASSWRCGAGPSSKGAQLAVRLPCHWCGSASPRSSQVGPSRPTAGSAAFWPLWTSALGTQASTADTFCGKVAPSSRTSSPPRDCPLMATKSCSGWTSARNQSRPRSKYSSGVLEMQSDRPGALKQASAKAAQPREAYSAARGSLMPPPEPLTIITAGCGPGVAGRNSVPTRPCSRTSRRITPSAARRCTSTVLAGRHAGKPGWSSADTVSVVSSGAMTSAWKLSRRPACTGFCDQSRPMGSMPQQSPSMAGFMLRSTLPQASAMKQALLCHCAPRRTVAEDTRTGSPGCAPRTTMRRGTSISSSAGLTSMEKLGMTLLLVLGHHHGGSAVAADGGDLQALLGGPDILVVVQRDHADIVGDQLGRIAQDGFTLGGVEFRGGIGQGLVHGRIAVVVPVGGADALLGIDRAQHVDQRIAGFAGAIAPGQDRDGELVLVGARRIGRPRQHLDLGLDADAGPELGHGLQGFRRLRVAVVGHVDGQLEAFREPGLGQQLLGLRGVEGDVLDLGVVAEGIGRHPLVGFGRRALQDAVDQGLAIDGQRHGATHAHIQQRVLLKLLAVVVGDEGAGTFVEARLDQQHAQAVVGVDLDVGRLLQLGQVGDRDLVDHIDVTREQRGGAGRTVVDVAVIDLVPQRLAAPVFVVTLHHHAVARGVGDELVRAGTDHGRAAVVVLGGGLLAHVLADDMHRRQVQRQVGVGDVGLDDQGQRILGGDRLDRAQIAGEGGHATRHGTRALVGEDHVLGGEGLAILPLDVGTQLELPGLGIDVLPAHGQAGDQLVVVVLDQQVPEMQVHRAVAGVVVQLRVQRRQRVGEGDVEVLRVRRIGGGSQGHAGQGDGQQAGQQGLLHGRVPRCCVRVEALRIHQLGVFWIAPLLPFGLSSSAAAYRRRCCGGISAFDTAPRGLLSPNGRQNISTILLSGHR
eukprot:TRINITY_DN1184_c0_g1_i1.p1 TRINITY_DN1184_c0_g1~~TRINITY_DN1184_c0_g1_i1.p1  ORF type:complete len:1061 (-),score=340.56 TRINITY_DN1184_c0_g1_i1:401-3583(-)